VAQWVVQAEQPVEIPNTSESAWCRHLAGSPPPPASLHGVPLIRDGVFGTFVVGGVDLNRLDRWRDTLALFVDACGDALLLCRAGRHKPELSVALFHLANYPELVANLGPHGAEEVLSQMVELIRSRTRKVNSLARVSDSALAPVIPEASESVADRIADELRTVAQGSSFGSDDAPGKHPIRLKVRTPTVTNPGAVDSALDNLSSPN
jgi:GGDEF domain-containing protein